MDTATLDSYLRRIGHGDSGLRLALADWYAGQTGDQATAEAVREARSCEAVLRRFPAARPADKGETTEWLVEHGEVWPEFRTLAAVAASPRRRPVTEATAVLLSGSPGRCACRRAPGPRG